MAAGNGVRVQRTKIRGRRGLVELRGLAVRGDRLRGDVSAHPAQIVGGQAMIAVELVKLLVGEPGQAPAVVGFDELLEQVGLLGTNRREG